MHISEHHSSSPSPLPLSLSPLMLSSFTGSASSSHLVSKSMSWLHTTLRSRCMYCSLSHCSTALPSHSFKGIGRRVILDQCTCWPIIEEKWSHICIHVCMQCNVSRYFIIYSWNQGNVYSCVHTFLLHSYIHTYTHIHTTVALTNGFTKHWIFYAYIHTTLPYRFPKKAANYQTRQPHAQISCICQSCDGEDENSSRDFSSVQQ